jgi:hypothetical protein
VQHEGRSRTKNKQEDFPQSVLGGKYDFSSKPQTKLDALSPELSLNMAPTVKSLLLQINNSIPIR